MALPKFENDIAYVSKLDDEPNDVGGLSADELKAVFDKAGLELQEYINEELIPRVESDIEAAALGIGGGGALSGEMLAPGTVTADKLANGSVTADKIVNTAVTNEKIADKAVNSEKIADSGILTVNLADKAVTREKIADEAVSADKIFPAAVTNAKIATGAVTNEKIANGAVTNEKIAPGAVTRAELGADAKPLAFTNQTIATSAWVSDSTYSSFRFRASVACSGVTTNFCPFVIFSPADAQSGKFAPVAVSYDGGVYIYASSKPNATVTIPTILCIPTA